MNYNFKNEETKRKAIYRLFVVYVKTSQYVIPLGKRKQTYRGYYAELDKGRSKLMSIFLERINDIELAILYNDRKKTKQILTATNEKKVKKNITVATARAAK